MGTETETRTRTETWKRTREERRILFGPFGLEGSHLYIIMGIIVQKIYIFFNNNTPELTKIGPLRSQMDWTVRGKNGPLQ